MGSGHWASIFFFSPVRLGCSENIPEELECCCCTLPDVSLGMRPDKAKEYTKHGGGGNVNIKLDLFFSRIDGGRVVC